MVFGFLKNKIAAQSLYTRDFTAAMRLAEAAEGITPALFQKWMRRSQAGKGLAVSSDEDEDEDKATILHFFSTVATERAVHGMAVSTCFVDYP